ncbi:MAG: DinB family protein [Microscillaceae bacterium]|nr:DinB family protein [Microscillaceae bacterium]
MTLNAPFIKEIEMESTSTLKVFERIPEDKLDWRPHPKSWTLAQLASHIAEMGNWITMTINQPELDFATMGDYKAFVATSVKELIECHQKNTEEAITALKNADDETMMTNWKMRSGETIYIDEPRVDVIRNTILNHLYHHRGQLTVYLRLNDAPLPNIYGPTADESSM